MNNKITHVSDLTFRCRHVVALQSRQKLHPFIIAITVSTLSINFHNFWQTHTQQEILQLEDIWLYSPSKLAKRRKRQK